MRVLATVALLACLVGCSRVPAVEESAVDQILADASEVLSQFPIGDLSEENWPESFSQLAPERISIASEGIYIVTSSFFVHEAGVFIPRERATFSVEPGGDPAYVPMCPGLYEFRIKG